MQTEADYLLSLMQKCAMAIFADRREQKPAIAPKVKAYILSSLVNRQRAPDLETVCDKFAVSNPTMRRKLKAENTSYQRLLDEVRFELAKKLLMSGLPIDQIAEHLDFSASSGLSRAFKDWCGVCPLKWVGQQRV
jgi:AraC-like DNA-binding protein